jgi:hypothetical protein
MTLWGILDEAAGVVGAIVYVCGTEEIAYEACNVLVMRHVAKEYGVSFEEADRMPVDDKMSAIAKKRRAELAVCNDEDGDSILTKTLLHWDNDRRWEEASRLAFLRDNAATTISLYEKIEKLIRAEVSDAKLADRYLLLAWQAFEYRYREFPL